MTIPTPRFDLGQPPSEYDPRFFEGVVQVLHQFMAALNSESQIQTATLLLSKLPDAGYGLKLGAVYHHAGVLKIVRSIDTFFVALPAMTSALGAVNPV